MSESKFEGRMITQEITGEFLAHLTGAGSIEDAVGIVEPHIHWFERNYNAVAEVSRTSRRDIPYDGVTVRAIAALDADIDEVQRGIQAIQYRIGNED